MTSKTEKLASIAQWDALQARYPLASPFELVRQSAVLLIANLVTVRLVLNGQMQPWELVALVAVEAVALTGIAWLQTRFVPAEARMDKPKPLRERLSVALFGLAWLGFVYAIILGAFLRDLEPLLAAARDPWTTLRTSALRWPLAISLGGALLDAVADWRHWRERGGYFLSTPGFNAAARWLTLFLGGIPFIVPIATVAWAIVTLAKRFDTRGRAGAAGRGLPIAQLLLLPALALGVFGLMGWLIQAGVLGWAIGYTSAKLVSEALILFLPLIAVKASAEERAALDGPSRRSS